MVEVTLEENVLNVMAWEYMHAAIIPEWNFVKIAMV